MLVNIDSSITNVTETDNFIVEYNDPIDLGDRNWEVALVSTNLWYSWYNISAEKNNNIIRYNNGVTTETVVVPDGQYTINQLNAFFHDAMRDNGDYTAGSTPDFDEFNITLDVNYSTLRVKIIITGGYELDLTQGLLYKLLGGNQAVYDTSGDLEYVANVNDSINNLIIHCSILDSGSSYSNSSRSDVLYTFVPSSEPGTNIEITPNTPVYIGINYTGSTIRELRMYITDNLGRRVNLNGEPVSYLLHFRPL